MRELKYIFVLMLITVGFSSLFSQNFDLNTAINGNCGIVRRVSVYGDDNREEYCAQNMIIRELADSVAAFFRDDGHSIVKSGNTYRLAQTTLSQSERLSPGERFSDQPASSFCTGFLISDDMMVTAGHCVRDNLSDTSDHIASGCNQNTRQGVYCKDIKIVFGYKKNIGGIVPVSISEDNVYSCDKVVAHSFNAGPDYTVIKLDRKVKNIKPLAVDRKNSALKVGTEVFAIGHPSGLPLKIAGNAEVIKLNEDMQVNRNGTKINYLNKNYSFLTNLDTFHGNSGSPVLNAKTLMVEGILVSGDEDYVHDPSSTSTNITARYQEHPSSNEYGSGVGEVATKISVLSVIPVTQREKDMIDMNKRAGGDLYRYLLNELLNYSNQNNNAMQNGVVPIPNFTPDSGAVIQHPVYHPDSIPIPSASIEI